VRRGRELGFHYGIETSRRKVKVSGIDLVVVRFQAILSPPPLLPGATPMGDRASRAYRPVVDVLFLPDAEVLIVREPDGFSDEEVEAILQAVSISPQ
jgi:hypothetical protein